MPEFVGSSGWVLARIWRHRRVLRYPARSFLLFRRGCTYQQGISARSLLRATLSAGSGGSRVARQVAPPVCPLRGVTFGAGHTDGGCPTARRVERWRSAAVRELSRGCIAWHGVCRVCFERWFIRYPRPGGLIRSENRHGTGVERSVPSGGIGGGCIASEARAKGERLEGIQRAPFTSSPLRPALTVRRLLRCPLRCN